MPTFLETATEEELKLAYLRLRRMAEVRSWQGEKLWQRIKTGKSCAEERNFIINYRIGMNYYDVKTFTMSALHLTSMKWFIHYLIDVTDQDDLIGEVMRAIIEKRVRGFTG